MPDGALERQFHSKMTEIHERAARECSYHATRFIQMVNHRGGVAAARALLHSSRPAQGLTTLWEHGRLDLSVEAHVCQLEWQDLFTGEEVAIAKKRLNDFGYDAQAVDP